ncbi:hypothetical protein [Pseudogemmobacter sp. W21_MBD1_M6]|uniref:hypothetical protein n=1 Tax=Pseudogemmobacter sp. W21_MBD1_M6 TaxID=3240271 RepID=UPI003F9B9484
MTYFIEHLSPRGFLKAIAVGSVGVLSACGGGGNPLGTGGTPVALTGTVDVLALDNGTLTPSATQGLYDAVADTVTIAGTTYPVDRNGNLYSGLIEGGAPNQVGMIQTPVASMPTMGTASYTVGKGRAFVTDAVNGTAYDVTMSATLNAVFSGVGAGVDLAMSNPAGTQITGQTIVPYPAGAGGTITVNDMAISGASFTDAPGTTVSVAGFGAGGILIQDGVTVTLNALGNFAGPSANEVGVVGGVRDLNTGNEAVFNAIAR